MRVRIDRIVVRGALEPPDAPGLGAAVRAELSRALQDVAAPARHGRPVRLVQTTAPHGAAPAPAIAAAVRSVLGGGP
jgi:hypothetical protein